MDNLKSINKIEITEKDTKNYKYEYQEFLTNILDKLDETFNQEIINEIVLWKVNRFVNINYKNDTLLLLNQIKKDSNTLNEELTKQILQNLLQTPGIQIAMASTILRFKNPNIYQILDQRVYRLIYDGKKLKDIKNKKIDIIIAEYLKYLSDLKELCETKNIPYSESDRILYLLDKRENKNYPIDY